MAGEIVRPTKPQFKLKYLFTGQNRRNLQTYNEDYAMYQWHLQNQYNSPAAQMQRYKEAGLNTNLMYGQGTPGNAEAPYKVGEYDPISPVVDKIKPLAVLNGVMDLGLKKARVEQAQEMANMSVIDRMDKQNHFNNNWNSEFDFENGQFGMKNSQGKFVPVDLGAMPIEQRKKYESLKKAYYEAENEKERNKLQKMLVDFYTANQIFKYIGALGPTIGRFF